MSFNEILLWFIRPAFYGDNLSRMSTQDSVMTDETEAVGSVDGDSASVNGKVDPKE